VICVRIKISSGKGGPESSLCPPGFGGRITLCVLVVFFVFFLLPLSFLADSSFLDHVDPFFFFDLSYDMS
jgi:hypothetical protein